MPAETPDGPGALLDLSRSRRIHVVGVGGAGMSAMATVLVAMGHSVSGSDLRASPVTDRLAADGVSVVVGHRPENVGEADMVTFSPAVGPSNPELVEAGRRGIPVVRRAEVLASIAATKRCLAVAGTHGKTTTSSMLSLILVEAGMQPSFLIGADVNEIGTNARWGPGAWMVVEADESYGTFQAIRPEIAVVTNIEPDHLDHYQTVEALEAAFSQFVAGATGPSVVGADDPVSSELGRRHGSLSVGVSADATYQMTDVELARSSVGFSLRGPGGPLGRVEVPMPGLYNATNAAVAAVAALCAGAPIDAALEALARFAGVPRRFEFRGEANGVTFVDDYAHLPGEVRSVLAAARAGGWRRVVAVFQPHRYSRTAALASQFATAFDDADVVVVTDVYSAGDRPIPGVSGQLVADAVAAARPDLDIRYAPTRDDVRRVVVGLLEPGDLCCTLGAGDLTSLPDELMADRRW